MTHDNAVRLNSAIGYVTPADTRAGRAKAIFEERDRELAAARERRAAQRRRAVIPTPVAGVIPGSANVRRWTSRR